MQHEGISPKPGRGSSSDGSSTGGNTPTPAKTTDLWLKSTQLVGPFPTEPNEKQIVDVLGSLPWSGWVGTEVGFHWDYVGELSIFAAFCRVTALLNVVPLRGTNLQTDQKVTTCFMDAFQKHSFNRSLSLVYWFPAGSALICFLNPSARFAPPDGLRYLPSNPQESRTVTTHTITSPTTVQNPSQLSSITVEVRASEGHLTNMFTDCYMINNSLSA